MKTMSVIIVKLAPSEVIREFITYGDDSGLICAAKLKSGEYQMVPAFGSFDVDGEEGAEVAFDLTNNPSRQQEREERYGRFRSVSVGDIVEVNGVDFLCDSFGWTRL